MHRSTLYIVSVVLAIVSCSSGEKNSSVRPNFIIILADDLGYNDIGCYGSRIIQTPNLDRLAESGMRFTDFHSNCSVCSPTRAALLTGRYQHRTGIVNVLGQTSQALPMIQGLPKKSITIADVLKQAGYQTAIFGKWHLGNIREFHPLDYGFEYYFGSGGGMENPFTYLPANAGPQTQSILLRNREVVDGPGRYYTYRLADELNNYVGQRDKSRPFFIYLPFTAPHLPLWKPDDSLTVWDGNKFGPHPDDLEAAYRATIEAMDLAIGEIVSALEEHSLRSNTLLFFTSDNGPVDVGSCEPFTGRKSNLYEGGTRVPAIASWPGKINQGQINDELLITMDLFPTLVNLAEIGPEQSIQTDGIDFSGVLLRNERLPDRYLFWEKPLGVGMDRFHIRREAVRKGDWKYLKNPELVNELHVKFLSWRENVYADAPLSLDGMIEYLVENSIINE